MMSNGPQDIMMFGTFEFGGSVKHYTILVITCITVGA